MFDICTHVGRRLVNDRIEDANGQLCNTQFGYFGGFPTNLLAEEFVYISSKHKLVEGTYLSIMGDRAEHAV